MITDYVKHILENVYFVCTAHRAVHPILYTQSSSPYTLYTEQFTLYFMQRTMDPIFKYRLVINRLMSS